jgi:hypothetical protein
MSEYDGINSLNELEVGTPLDGASNAELVLAIRQLKSVVKNVLLTSLRPNGALRGITVDSLASDAVGTQQVINEAVTAAKIAALAVVTSKIADGAVTAQKLADGSVTEAKLGDNAISSRTFGDNSIPLRAFGTPLTGDQISKSGSNDANRAIAGEHIKSNAIADRHVSNVAIGKLTGGTVGQLMVRGADAWVAAALTGGLTFDPVTNSFSLVDVLKAAYVADVKTRGSNGGATLADTWMTRDLGELVDTANLLNFSGNSFSLIPGKYLLYIRCPAHGAVGKHQARLLRDNGDSTLSVIAWGSSASGAADSNTESVIVALFEEEGDVGHSYKVEQWFENAVATSGLGIAASSNNTVVYANHTEVYTEGFIVKV